MEINLLEQLYEDIDAHCKVLSSAKEALNLPDTVLGSVYPSAKTVVELYIDNAEAFTEDGVKYEGPCTPAKKIWELGLMNIGAKWVITGIYTNTVAMSLGNSCLMPNWNQCLSLTN